MSEQDTPDGIDRDPVTNWFEQNIDGAEPPLSFDRIAGGRSNLTYRVEDADGRSWALRRPPLGKTLGSAHDMGREHSVMSALGATDVPVPPVVGFCEDPEVNEAPFFVMDFVAGPVLRSREDADRFEEAEREAIGERVIDTLVAIHAVDPDGVGLGDLGKKADYVPRQLHRWQGQWEKSKTRELELVEEVHRKLEARIPEQGPAAIVHGDYRLDNMILTEAGEVAAVVDWELCTLGDPLADVGMLVVYWSEEGDDLVPLFEPATMREGFQSRERVVEMYAEKSGRDLGQIDFYVALGYWKLAIILEGVLSRYKAGGYGEPGSEEEEGLASFEQTVVRVTEAADEAVERLS